VALGSLVTVNAAMIGVMTMTPLHLENGGQSLAIVGIVFSLHVGAMFLPSPATGWVTDRVGRLPVIAASGTALVLAGVLAAVSPPGDAGLVTVALVLLGLAWNLGLVSGSALLTDAFSVAARPRAQGRADLAMGIAGSVAGFGSGLVVAAGGFGLLAAVGAACGLVLVALAARGRALAPQPG
jgi:MFS family permease